MLLYVIGVIILVYGIANGEALAGCALCFWCCFFGSAIRDWNYERKSKKAPPNISSVSSRPISKDTRKDSIEAPSINTTETSSPSAAPKIIVNTSLPLPPSPGQTIRTDNRDRIATPQRNQDVVDYLRNERDAFYFVHFTPIDNVEGILQCGLRPRTLQQIKGQWTDQYRLDGYLDCSCLSISFPNYQMLYKKRQEKKYTFVILKISVNAINCVERKDVAFFPNNAASSSLSGSFYSHVGLSSAKDMFADTVSCGGRTVTRTELNIPSSYATFPQAEVLIRGVIPPKYIKEIIVPSFSFVDSTKAVCRRNGLNINVRVDDSLYRPRCDWMFWKSNTSHSN